MSSLPASIKSELIIDFNEVDIRIYLPEKVIFIEAAIEVSNCFVIFDFVFNCYAGITLKNTVGR